MPSYLNIDDFDAVIVQASLDSQVLYKFIDPVSFILVIRVFLADEHVLVAQCRWTVDMTFIIVVASIAAIAAVVAVVAVVVVDDGSNTRVKACYRSGLLDEYIFLTPYFVHNIGLAGLIVIITFLEYIWLYLYLCLMFCVGMSCIYGKQRQYLLEACPWCVFVLLVLCECFYCVCECVDVGCPCLNYNYNHYHSHHMLSH